MVDPRERDDTPNLGPEEYEQRVAADDMRPGRGRIGADLHLQGTIGLSEPLDDGWAEGLPGEPVFERSHGPLLDAGGDLGDVLHHRLRGRGHQLRDPCRFEGDAKRRVGHLQPHLDLGNPAADVTVGSIRR